MKRFWVRFKTPQLHGRPLKAPVSGVPYYWCIFGYEPWKPGDEVRVGKCMNCGEEIWEAVQTIDVAPEQKCICSPECHAEFEAYLEKELEGQEEIKEGETST